MARVRGHGLVVKAIYSWSGPCNSAAQYKQTNKYSIRAYYGKVLS